MFPVDRQPCSLVSILAGHGPRTRGRGFCDWNNNNMRNRRYGTCAEGSLSGTRNSEFLRPHPGILYERPGRSGDE